MAYSSGRQPNCGVEQRAPPMFGRATITLGIGPHSSFYLRLRTCQSCLCIVVVVDNGKEILSMNEVLSYMLRSSRMLCEETELSNLLKLDESDWLNYVGEVRGMIVTYPGMVRNCLCQTI